ncbi:MAG: hypothetical protein CMJ64_11875 [Planctomycetaceae bacterium]|nr:hypothetical protein [Planctomycetaceae bacterium]
MVGHGGPRQAPLAIAPTGSKFAASIRGLRIAMCVCALVAFGIPAGAQDNDIRLRITWGEGSERHWSGRFQLSNGKFSEIQRLGFDANAATSIVNEGGDLQLRQPSPAEFDGIDVQVQAPAEAILTIKLEPDGRRDLETSFELRVADFTEQLGHQTETKLDDQNNRLIVRRAPGDHLRITSRRDTFVFAPQDVWQLSLQPHRLGIAAGTKLVCSLQLVSTKGRNEHWSEEHNLVTNADGSTQEIEPLQLRLPAAEGAYELVASLRERGFTAAIPGTLLVRRKVQCIVIDPQRKWPATGDWQELNADEAKWWEGWKRLKRLWPSNKQATSSHGQVASRPHLGQTLTELGVDSWQAAPLQVARPGIPHLLEIDYPSDIPQTLGISILEPDASGRVVPLQVDSGVDVIPLPQAGTAAMERHRIIFWPRTATPWLVLSNRRENRPAVFGKIRVSAGPTHLKLAPVSSGRGNGRMLAAYYDRPLFPDNFSATEALDEVPKRSLDDWNTFYEGGLRLADYLKHVGYNAAIISVARDGGTIYPSKLLDSTPRYDSGVFFLSGQDPQQKDILEMLFRLFDREQLQLVPAIHLANKLPELETILRKRGADATGIELVGGDGKPWVALYGSRGQAPYYNPLDPRVQAAIQNVVSEIVDRYSHHPSFAGVSLQLGPHTFAQLPGTVWGNDDRTVARFKADTKAEVPIDGGDARFSKRARFFKGAGRKVWLDWRAKKLAEFYQDIQQNVSRTRRDVKLYLAAAELATSVPVQRELHPRLPGKLDLADAMLQHGLDPDEIDEAGGIVLMRPRRLKPVMALADHGANMRLANSDSVDQLFQQHETTAVLNYHEPVTYTLPGFDQASPFGPGKTQMWFAAHISPNGLHNRARFIRSLAALDTQLIVEGGWMIPLGQEDSVRRQFEAFRMLPAAAFKTATPASPETTASSLVVRTLTRGVRTYYYVINNSPWPVSADIEFELPPRAMVQRFGTDPQVQLKLADGARTWSLTLEPYDLVAGFVNAPNAQVVDWRTEHAREIKPELTALVQDVTSRVDKLGKRTPLGVVANAGFEQRDSNGAIVAWQALRAPDVTIDLDSRNPFKGQSSLHMRVARENQIAWVRSKPFAPPKTGRISVLAWIRTSNAAKQPPLRLAVDDGRTYYHFAPLGKDVDKKLRPTGNPAEKLPQDWPRQPYMFHLDDLPASGIDQLMIGFDLMGRGEVWIDDVEVYDLYFFPNEVNELLKNVANADFHLDNGRIADCDRFLNGYWPRFLMEHVSQARLAQVPIRQDTPPNTNPPVPEEKPSGFQRFIPSFKVKNPFSSDDE